MKRTVSYACCGQNKLLLNFGENRQLEFSRALLCWDAGSGVGCVM